MTHTFGDYRLYTGTDGSDRYPGTPRMDLAFGMNAGDRLRGWTSDDDLRGGDGNDFLAGGDGADHIAGGKGEDHLLGGAAPDRLVGQNGQDHLDEGAGHGDLDGGAGNDILIGGTGADAFMVRPGSGDDIIKDFQAGPGIFDHVALEDIMPEDLRFEDTSRGVRISWVAEDGNGSILLEGVKKTELAQDDFMFADDRMLIRPAGSEAKTVTATSFAKIEGEDQAAANPGGDDPGSRTNRIEQFLVKVGTPDSDSFQASPHHDFYFGQEGDDRLFGSFGDDDLHGDAGDDTLDGGEGSDHLMGATGDDELFGGAMTDNLMGGEGSDELHAGGGHDMIEGGMGNDTLDGGDGADAFMVDPASGDDIVVGGFDAGPGAFDHIALMDILPDEVTVADTSRGGQDGVLVSWSSKAHSMQNGSIFLQGLSKSELAQDDFMFDSVEGGAFVPDPAIRTEGSRLIFGSSTTSEITSRLVSDLNPGTGI